MRFDPKAISGFVNFPLDKPSSGEGGTFVRLIVIPNDFDAGWQKCMGGYQHFIFDETFEGDDKTAEALAALGPMPDDDAVVTWYEEYQRIEHEYIDRYFPEYRQSLIKAAKTDAEVNGDSIPLHAVLTIGSTGWSGEGWVARRSDLDPRGEALFRSLEALYPDCEIRLLTFKDT